MTAQDWIYLPDSTQWINMAQVFTVIEFGNLLELRVIGIDYVITVNCDTNKEDASIILRYLVQADN
jgi:hypothetical protein